MKKSIIWAAIRHTDGEDWIDTRSLSTDRVDCEIKAQRENETIPIWAQLNPIKYFAKVEIKIA